MLENYQDFLQRVNKLGFLPLSRLAPGLPFLENETRRSAWHTGNPETDPWRWKDRAAEERRLAYGCILGGHKGFVARRAYALFYAANQPSQPMPERWQAGVVSQATWQMWKLFEQHDRLDTSQARRMLGRPGKETSRAADAALKELQRDYYITVAGSAQKISAAGQAYGWPSLVYCRVRSWIPEDWLAEAEDWDAHEARQAILEGAAEAGAGIDLTRLAKRLGWHA